MRFVIYSGILIFLFMATLIGASQEAEPVIVNLMIDVTVPASATEDQAKIVENNLNSMYRAVNSRDLRATIFSTRDAVDSYVRLRLANIGLSPNFELAMSGSRSDERLSNEPYERQLAILEESKKFVELCRICGKNNITAKGFMPQSFDQNQDTYKALDNLGIKYDAGFQAGLLYAPGHENDVWPYQIEGYDLYAVPVSTYSLSGEEVILRDSYFEENGMGASQWYDALVGKFDEIQGKDEPMVVSLTTSVSGSGEFLDATERFMDYAAAKGASFVTSNQLVEMAKTGVRDVSELPAEVSEVCTTCGQSDSGANITVSLNNSTQAA